MNLIFNFGFIALAAAGLHRYIVSTQTGKEYLDFFSLQSNDLIAYALAIAWAALAFWNILIRWQCPKCRSKSYSLRAVEELDRWVGTKNVDEKLSDGSYAKRAVTTTFVKIKKNYYCNGCDYAWSAVVKKEKS
ncbi:hypothetical protein [Vibrio sagamiensis]|uniref:Uncharacterized protein n=1 Tax=Vibrio sagamiensis NBRC 104589 TaxID=1219064 RepID=A0A511QK75_9VIBR|nr:hypothetical protein [Vibrio sagamiensis]PNQ59599.1 hypothetical protein C1141_12410 [Vibrio agarivorans]GEM77723.1 hypothetical protein VSA01S_38350 [Vibrio sagamiensis NBRC 104589]